MSTRRFNASALVSAVVALSLSWSGAPVAAAPVPPVNTLSRAAVVALYNSVHSNTVSTAQAGWTGSYFSCFPGMLSSQFREQAYTQLNYYRALAGVPSSVTENETYRSQAQAASLIWPRSTTTNPHDLLATDPCYTTAGDTGAGSGNFFGWSGGVGYNSREVVQSWMDDGLGDMVHRYGILHPPATQTGFGWSPHDPANGALWGSSYLNVFDQTFTTWPTLSTPSGALLWPPAGFVPRQDVWRAWSMWIPGADMSNATVTMTRDGVPITSPVIFRETRGAISFPASTLVWQPDMPLDGTHHAVSDDDTVYQVTIDGIPGRAPITYATTVISPELSLALPGATSAFRASAGNGQVSLSWVAPTSGGTVSDYYIRQSINGGPFTVVADGVSTATSFTVSGLTNGVSYRFVVNALNTAGLGPTSLSVTVVPGLPGATSGFKGVAGNGQVSLSWVAPTSGGTVSDYYIRQSINGGPFTVVADGVSTATSFTVSGLTNGVSYRFVVNALNTAGLGPTSLSVTVVPGLPGATSGFKGVAGNGQVSLSWVAPTSGGTVSDYYIRQSINGGPFTVVADGVSTATSFTVSGLTNGVSYRFVVNALNTAGLGPTSLSVTVVPGLPGATSGFKGVAGNGQVSLSWVAPTSGGTVSDYYIRQSINGGPFTVVADGVSTATSFTVTGLTNGTSYRFVVNALNTAGLGPTSLSTTAIPTP